MLIDYDFRQNAHTREGAKAAVGYLFADHKPTSLLDVGCGPGTWLRAAMDCGIGDVIGVDGQNIPEDNLLFPVSSFRRQDLREYWTLERRFEAVLCMEVAEHLEERYAEVLVGALVRHSDWVLFAAASPGQPGQHHVNCQWPSYWQNLFNHRGFACSDELRWRMWDDSRIEPWYRQNTFVARLDVALAGREPRLRGVIHPGMQAHIVSAASLQSFSQHVHMIERGQMPTPWYLKVLVEALLCKVGRPWKK